MRVIGPPRLPELPRGGHRASGAQKWDRDRDETEAQRLDRNWSSLLQELRVAQTGVQLLTGFLLTLPFSNDSLSSTT